MTNMYKIPCAVLFLALFSCSDDDVELPRSEPDFNIKPAVAEVGVPVTFDNLTLNASRYEWDFGDNQTSEETSPTHTFDEPGTFVVTLKAYTNDNQMDSVFKDVTVGQRYLTGLEFHSLNFSNPEGEPWDNTESADTAKYPDVIYFLGANANSQEPVIISLGGNLTPNDLPFGFEMDPILLTNEDWSIVFYDFDGEDPENPAEDDFEPMYGFTFNPVLTTSFETDEGQRFLQLAEIGFHINLLFEIR